MTRAGHPLNMNTHLMSRGDSTYIINYWPLDLAMSTKLHVIMSTTLKICDNRPFAIRGMWHRFMKMKVVWFCLRKTISGSYLKQNNGDLVF